MKHIFFIFGLIFLGLAFMGAAIEVAARAMTSDLGWLPSIGKVWGTVSPGSLESFLATQSWGGWPKIFNLPTLAVFGLPGFFLVLVFKNQGEHAEAEQEASLFLFDELVKRAKEDDFSHFDPTDPTSAQDTLAADALIEDAGPERDFLLHPKAQNAPIPPKTERPA